MLLDKDFVMQGGVRNYLGKTEEVTAPKYWQSSENSPLIFQPHSISNTFLIGANLKSLNNLLSLPATDFIFV